MAALFVSICTLKKPSCTASANCACIILAVWHESTLFTEKERAALQWAESLTRIFERGIRDADYAAVRAHFDEEELVALTHAINTINVWNRLNVAFATPAGSMDGLMGLEKAGLI